MSQADQQLSSVSDGNVIGMGSEAQAILFQLRALRRGICEWWQERAVTLTAEEQRMLVDEIRDTCALLTDLTAGE